MRGGGGNIHIRVQIVVAINVSGTLEHLKHPGSDGKVDDEIEGCYHHGVYKKSKRIKEREEGGESK